MWNCCSGCCRYCGFSYEGSSFRPAKSSLKIPAKDGSLKAVPTDANGKVTDAKVQKVIGSWEKYTEFQKVILDVKVANLSFFRDNNEILTVLIDELKTTIPEMVNTPQVMARIIALETTLYKLESNVNLSNAKKETVISAVKEFLIAFSNLNLQMNKKLEKESQNIQKPY